MTVQENLQGRKKIGARRPGKNVFLKRNPKKTDTTKIDPWGRLPAWKRPNGGTKFRHAKTWYFSSGTPKNTRSGATSSQVSSPVDDDVVSYSGERLYKQQQLMGSEKA